MDRVSKQGDDIIHTLLRTFAITGLLALAPAASAQIQTTAPGLQGTVSAPTSSKLDTDVRRISTPVRSQADLDIYVQSYSDTFLDLLPADAKQEFLAGVTFNERGITSFPVDVIETHLTASEAHRFLSYFGMQGGTKQLGGLDVDTALDSVVMSGSALAASRIDPSNPRISETHSLSQDFLEGYQCAGQGSCAKADGWACTSNC